MQELAQFRDSTLDKVWYDYSRAAECFGGRSMIQFRFNASKALEAIQWMLATANEPVDFHALLKAVYFADKQMLNDYGRPIFGANYRAMNYGPVPLEVYEMLKCEPYWLAELDLQDYPWVRSGYKVQLPAGPNALPQPDHLAPAEMDALQTAFHRSRRMNFTERTRETHGMDWVEGSRRPGNRMAYEDMVDARASNRDELLEDLEAMGPRIAL